MVLVSNYKLENFGYFTILMISLLIERMFSLFTNIRFFALVLGRRDMELQ